MNGWGIRAETLSITFASTLPNYFLRKVLNRFSVNMFDPEKLNEYKLRILLSLLIILLVIFATVYRGINGIASIEIIFIGLLFALVSLFHAVWAIIKIKKSK